MQTGYLQDNDGPDGEQFNVIFRKHAETMTQWLGYYLRPDNTWPPASDSAWCIGCVASAGAGAASTITTGSILHYDPSYYTSTQDGVETLPDWMLIPVPAVQSAAHSENSSGSTRVDLVCIDAAPATGPTTTVAQYGGGSLSRPITFGAIPVLKVVEGSPGGGAPALPSGYVQLASVSVPTGTTSANWSSNVTYTDSRTLLRSDWRAFGMADATAAATPTDLTVQKRDTGSALEAPVLRTTEGGASPAGAVSLQLGPVRTNERPRNFSVGFRVQTTSTVTWTLALVQLMGLSQTGTLTLYGQIDVSAELNGAAPTNYELDALTDGSMSDTSEPSAGEALFLRIVLSGGTGSTSGVVDWRTCAVLFEQGVD